jgi:Ca2+-binding EF-hand superfamily protein
MAIPKYDDLDKKPVKMTETLKVLQNTRQQKIEEEVEEEFRLLQERKTGEM